MDNNALDAEWGMLKVVLYKKYGSRKRVQVPSDTQSPEAEAAPPKAKLSDLTWEDVNNEFGLQFPNILSLMDLILSIPPSSADCERGFSQVKLVKNDWRSTLTNDSLNDLLMVQLETPSIEEYDPKPAIEYWINDCKRKRRPIYMDKDQEKIEEEREEEDDLVVSKADQVGIDRVFEMLSSICLEETTTCDD